MIEAVIIAGAPLALTALGGLISERAGVLNIALEGCIGAGAFTTALLISLGIPVFPAILAALGAGMLFGAVLATVHLSLGANLFIAGLGINLLIPSLSGMVSQLIRGNRGNIRLPEEILKGVGNQGIPLFAWAVIPMAAGLVFLLSRSSFGRRIRAVGTAPDFLSERGLMPWRTQASALMISSAAAALAGAFIVIRIGAYVPGISAGRGWIALVVIWLGFRQPFGIIIASYFFALMEIGSGRAQGTGKFPATLFLALPYLAALVALILTSAGKKRKNSGD